MARVSEIFRPYTFEDYVKDSNPQTWSDLKELERNWNSYKNDFSKVY